MSPSRPRFTAGRQSIRSETWKANGFALTLKGKQSHLKSSELCRFSWKSSESPPRSAAERSTAPPCQNPLNDYVIKRVVTNYHLLGTSGSPLALVMNPKTFETFRSRSRSHSQVLRRIERSRVAMRRRLRGWQSAQSPCMPRTSLWSLFLSPLLPMSPAGVHNPDT
jgi:hypothetical protein